jgi:hypothetical protein
MIGPFLVEWNSSALCVPRKCVSKAALLSVDIESIATLRDFDNKLKALAQVICKWNSEYTYEAPPRKEGDTSKIGNCQEFVIDVLAHLNIQLPNSFLNSSIGIFLNDMRVKGSSKMTFKSPNAEFSKIFAVAFKGKSHTKMTFKTHEQLDRFVQDLENIDLEFVVKYKNEYNLLKGFDRAFWMRHLHPSATDEEKKMSKSTSKMETIDTGEESEVCTCPFNDPRETISMIFLER